MLDQTLAKTILADYQTAVMVLHCAGHDFRR